MTFSWRFRVTWCNFAEFQGLAKQSRVLSSWFIKTKKIEEHCPRKTVSCCKGRNLWPDKKAISVVVLYVTSWFFMHRWRKVLVVLDSLERSFACLRLLSHHAIWDGVTKTEFPEPQRHDIALNNSKAPFMKKIHGLKCNIRTPSLLVTPEEESSKC